MAYQQHRATNKYKNHRAEYCSALAATAEQKKACIEERTSARDYLPWGYELFSWPEGITTWAIIFTGFVIAWQSWETRRAAEATKDATDLARTMQKKERAQLSIERISTVGESPEEPRPGIVVITNQGPIYAFDVSCQMNCFVSREWDLAAIPKLFPQGIPVILKSMQAHPIEWEIFSLLPDDRPDDGDDPVRDKKVFLHIYVIVSYRDIFGDMPDSVLHMRWNVDIEEDIDTGDKEYPYAAGSNNSEWIRVPPVSEPPQNPN